MIREIALISIFGRSLLFYFGIITLLFVIATASFAIIKFKGYYKWHVWFARVTVCLALIHGIMALSLAFKF